MELGVALPTSAPYASAESIVRIAQEAERLGYTSLWTYERLVQNHATFSSIRHALKQSRPLPPSAPVYCPRRRQYTCHWATRQSH